MSFDVTPDAYARFMGRFSEPLAVLFADRAELRTGHRALDVGCGTGALTAQLVERLAAPAVAAIDPSPAFITATRARFPGLDARVGVAEQIPFPDHTFDRALAQLVVHFMADAVAGLSEMARVTRPGGLVAACVWDHATGVGPLSTFWHAVHDVDPQAPGEAWLPGVQEGHLAPLFAAAGLTDLQPSTLTVTVRFYSFAQWWEPFTLGVGPAGDHVAALDDDERQVLRSRCAELLPAGPFELPATSWCVTARA
jgi:SAM-dependent methyltransferase